jgi:hypothetical protein
VSHLFLTAVHPGHPLSDAESREALTVRPALLADVVDGLARAHPLWRPLVHHDADRRTARRLIATEAYEVWLLGWTSGQGVDLHDHGGSHAAFRVVEGELTEIEWTPGGIVRHQLRVGVTRRSAAGSVHDVVNQSPIAATSIHAYSPPLSSMTFYDPVDGQPVRREAVAPALPLFDAAAVGRLLHPAGDRRRGV